MNVVKNKILFSFLIAVWIMISSLMGCTSRDARTGSLILKGNDYEKFLKKQMARASAEAPPRHKSPKMTDGEYERLGDAHFRQGNLEKAFMQYEKAIHLSPNETRIHYKRGLLLLAKGVHEEAIEAFEEVLKKEPDHALAHEGIGQALLKMSRFEDAKNHFQQALKGIQSFGELTISWASSMTTRSGLRRPLVNIRRPLL
jgi:tetratricopeptide (TPR) repeat protein